MKKMNAVDFEEMITIIQQDCGISTNYTILPADRNIVESFQQKEECANFFYKKVNDEILRRYLTVKRERIVPIDESYRTEILLSEELDGIALASVYQLYNHRDKRFVSLFGEFQTDGVEEILNLSKNQGRKFAFENTNEISDQAGNLKAIRAIILHAVEKRFSKLYSGLRTTLTLDYSVIVDDLKDKYGTEKPMPVSIPHYIQPAIDRSLPLVKMDEPVGKFTDDVQLVAEEFYDKGNKYRKDIVDSANSVIEILVDVKFVPDYLNPNEKKITVEFLSRANGFIYRSKQKSFRVTVLDPDEKL